MAMPVVLTYIFIFFSRIFDVSLGTLRIIYLTRGRSKLAASIGFIEVMLYIIALSMVLGNLDRPLNIVIYGLGFAAGNYVGSLIEEKVAVGYVNVQVITMHNCVDLEEALREMGFGVTSMECYGKEGLHRILHILMKRRTLPVFLAKMRELDRQAFISIFDTRRIMGGYFARMKAK
jgi:uncharacterized protein YebE (UPF0316 family)